MPHDIPKVLNYLGLNDSQIQAYLFILRNKEATLKTIANSINLSSPGAIKMLNEMVNKGFIKKFKAKTKKVYLLSDLDIFENQIINKKKDEIDEIRHAFEEMKSSYGVYPIKVTRIGSDILVDTIKAMIIKCKKVFEFIDRRGAIVRTDNKLEAYKDVDFETIYFDTEDSYSWGKRIELDTDKKYAHLISFEDKIKLTTSTKDTILIENEEIANTIQLLVNTIYKK